VRLFFGVLLWCWAGRLFCAQPCNPALALRQGFTPLLAAGLGLLTGLWLIAAGLGLMRGRTQRPLLRGSLILASGNAGLLIVRLLLDSSRWLDRSFGTAMALLHLMTIGKTLGSLAALFIVIRLARHTGRHPLAWTAGALLGLQLVPVLSAPVNLARLTDMLALAPIPWVPVGMQLSALAIPACLLPALAIRRRSTLAAMGLLRAAIVMAMLSALLWGLIQLRLIDPHALRRAAPAAGIVLINLVEGLALWRLVGWAHDAATAPRRENALAEAQERCCDKAGHQTNP
jgi:hypothetical protein